MILYYFFHKYEEVVLFFYWKQKTHKAYQTILIYIESMRVFNDKVIRLSTMKDIQNKEWLYGEVTSILPHYFGLNILKLHLAYVRNIYKEYHTI